jgi:hypothetical protein
MTITPLILALIILLFGSDSSQRGRDTGRTTTTANNKQRRGEVRVRNLRFSVISIFESLRNK